MSDELSLAERLRLLEQRLTRERAAREQAERLLEDKSRELFERSRQLQQEIEQRIEAERRAAEAAERARHEAALAAASERLRAIFETAVDAIVVIDAQGIIQDCNPAAERMFGYRADELIGRNVSCLMPEPHRSRHDEYIRRYLETGEARIIGIGREVTAVRADGTEFPADLAVAEMRVGDAVGFTGILRDVSERKRHEQHLRELNAALERQAQATREALARLEDTRGQLLAAEKLASLGELVAGVTHEVATPLGIAVTAASTLREEARQIAARVEQGSLRRSELTAFLETCSETARLIETNLQRASELMQGFKQIAADRVTEQLRRIALRQWLDQLLATLRPRLKRAPHRVEVDCPEDLALTTRPGALSQVLTNLIVNALVHAWDEGQQGTLRIVARPRDGGGAVLEVADDGRGIPDDVLPHVFEPYFTTRADRGSTGLGLHIVDKLVRDALGGELALEAAPGAGTRFRILLPDLDAGAA